MELCQKLVVICEMGLFCAYSLITGNLGQKRHVHCQRGCQSKQQQVKFKVWSTDPTNTGISTVIQRERNLKNSVVSHILTPQFRLQVKLRNCFSLYICIYKTVGLILFCAGCQKREFHLSAHEMT